MVGGSSASSKLHQKERKGTERKGKERQGTARRLDLVVEQPVQQAGGCGAQQVALQDCAGGLILCKSLAALQVQLQVLPAVLGFMGNALPPASSALQRPRQSITVLTRVHQSLAMPSWTHLESCRRQPLCWWCTGSLL